MSEQKPSYKGLTVLDIGSGPGSKAEAQFPEAKIVRMDADKNVKPDIVHDIRKPFPNKLKGKFNIVFMSHVLEHLHNYDAQKALPRIRELLVNGGELWIIVPSAEYAAQVMLQYNNNPTWHAVLYGGNNEGNLFQDHHTAFRLPDLRLMMRRHGFIDRAAFQGPFTIDVTTDGEVKRYNAVQNIVIGMKYDPPDEEETDDGTNQALQEGDDS